MEVEEEPLTYIDCKEYIEQCHVYKRYLLKQHGKNKNLNKETFGYCFCPNFPQCCKLVYQVLYRLLHVEWSETFLFTYKDGGLVYN